jgi:1,4-dihydroxy-2-naphthoate octaprenyltransferase
MAPTQIKTTMEALIIIYVMLLVSTALGLYLVYLSDVVVLALGGLCFLCGVLYTWGPVPISRQPLGEILSGIFYGFFIPMILLYVNMPKGTYLTYILSFKTISFAVNVLPIVTVILLSAVPVCVTANIMLANNICDVEKDVLVKRHTLPYYLGKRASLFLFAGIYYVAYTAIIIMVLAGLISPVCLVTLLTLIPVQMNINKFFKLQEKAVTFIVSIKNYILIMSIFTLTIFLSGLGR